MKYIMFKVEEKDEKTTIEYCYGDDDIDTAVENLVCDKIFDFVSKEFNVEWTDIE